MTYTFMTMVPGTTTPAMAGPKVTVTVLNGDPYTTSALAVISRADEGRSVTVNGQPAVLSKAALGWEAVSWQQSVAIGLSVNGLRIGGPTLQQIAATVVVA